MYERSAIVLERYFWNLFGFNKTSNLEQNYKNYCELFEKFNNFQESNNDEFQALEEFKNAEAVIEDIQSQEEKLYKKNAKYEYNRDLIFNDITQKPEEIEKCMIKIENDIAKTQNALVTLRENYVEAVRNYNERKSALAKCKKARKNAEAEYNAIFEVTKQNIENIPEEYIALAKSFSAEDDQEDLVNTMLDNGKDEKIPFNNAVVRNAVKVGYDIENRIIDSYLDVYNKTNKLITELLEGAVSVELHQKTIRNVSVKLHFLGAEKDYLVQFLDYERIMVIHGKRTHRNLMLEACENFNVDIEQINNLYTLLVKEITNKSTKKAYKELYNKSYLVGIEENDEKFKKEKNKINLATATIMNTNYWRLEGIKNIYTVFYKDVVEVFGKDLDEFEVPREPEEFDEDGEPIVQENVEIIEEAPVQAIAEEVIEPEPVEEFVLEQVSDDVPTLPGMAEAVQENEKGAKNTKAKTKNAEEEDGNIQVVEELSDADTYNDVFDVIEVEPEEKVAKKKAKKVKRYTRKKTPKAKVVVAEVLEEEPEKEIELDLDSEEEEEVKPQNVVAFEDVFDEIEEEPDIFGEKYKDIESKIAELDALNDLEDEFEEDIKPAKVQTIEELEENEVEPETVENFEEEQDIFENVEAVINKAEVLDEEEEENDNIEVIEDESEDEDDDFEGEEITLKETTMQLIEELDDEDMPYEEEDMPYEEEAVEESIFDNIENDEYEELNLKKGSKKAKETKTKSKAKTKATKTTKPKAKVAAAKKETKSKKAGILKNIMKLNAKDNKKVAEN